MKRTCAELRPGPTIGFTGGFSRELEIPVYPLVLTAADAALHIARERGSSRHSSFMAGGRRFVSPSAGS
eukprot:6214198-Pleurochrysis_carterae.AAC.1